MLDFLIKHAKLTIIVIFTGASVDYRDGYTGCIRALLLNGKHVDLKSYADRGLYGKSIISYIYFNLCFNSFQVLILLL